MNMKVALVAYDDSDRQNHNGTINSDIFSRCWRHMGAPTTFFELAHIVAPVGHFGYLDEAATVDTVIDVAALNLVRNAITRPVVNFLSLSMRTMIRGTKTEHPGRRRRHHGLPEREPRQKYPP